MTSANGSESQEFQFLHTMLRVKDLDKSLDFYTGHLGMKLLRKIDFPSGEFTLAFIGYGGESTHTVVELTHNWGQEEDYAHGNAFGHLAVGVNGIEAVCAKMEEGGVSIPRPPGPMIHGGPVIAFVEDPDGYKIELIERSSWNPEAD
jgi:lactoylglutathione lyase